QQHFPVRTSVVELGTPVDLRSDAIYRALYGVDDAAFPGGPSPGFQQMPPAHEWQRSRNEPMHRVEIGPSPAEEVLDPIRAPMPRRPLELTPELVGGRTKEICPSLVAGALAKKECGEQRPRRAPHQLARRMFGIARDERSELLRG